MRCRILVFLQSAYYDDVLREKDHYRNPVIELVAELDRTIASCVLFALRLQKAGG